VRDGDWLHTIWDSRGLGARIVRAALTPAELLFGAVTSVRASLYSSGMLATRATALPALSVGNLTVGGTGKTPLSAFLAARLLDAGAEPAIVLRGYGDDEPIVHQTLNPAVRVVVSPHRVAGIEKAAALGCDVVVLDDAFQHRRAKRVADVVVVSADSWRGGRRHLLPAGPWRERLTAVRRASLVVVTRKAASRDSAEAVANTVSSAGGVPDAIVHLAPGDLRTLDGQIVDAATLNGRSVLAVSAIGDPAAFAAQLRTLGASVVTAAFRDHHRFTSNDASTLAAKAERYDRTVCTLKDAVKLGSLWPGPSPLWYLSQRVVVERGEDALEAVLTTTLLARSMSTHPRRSARPTT
jgi:tetraacyldisaccharide 4'-kinase